MKIALPKITTLLLMIMIVNYTYAQDTDVREDDLGDVTDSFQEHFFEGLKQAAIENHDKAINAFAKCLEENPKSSVVQFEIGKSYLQLKDYELAEKALVTATTLEPNNEWYLDSLYEVYNKTNQDEKVISTLKKLSTFHSDYKVDLVKYYYGKQQFSEALILLDELDLETTRDSNRDYLRMIIYRRGDFSQNKIDFYTKRVSQYPDDEENYLQLIFEYSNKGKEEKAFEIAQKLLAKKPETEQVHIALYKFYLDKKETEKAINSLQTVLKSTVVDLPSKKKVLIDFLRYSKDKEAFVSVINNLAEIIKEVPENDQLINIMADYYKSTNNKAKAIDYMVTAEAPDINDFVSYKNYLLALTEAKKFDLVIQKTTEALELYPAQPLLYFLQGTAYNQKNNPKKAIDALEMGLEYSIDNPILESDILYQIAQSHKLMNDDIKHKKFLREAKKVLENAN